jgi:hypothetical protein
MDAQGKTRQYVLQRLGSLSNKTVKTDIEWKTPSPKPLVDFDLDEKKPELYRPCRHGPNHVTMGIRKLDWNNWIEMDSNFLWYHDLKVSELEKDIDAHVQYVDNAVTRDACFEVLEELTAYLTARYPKIFQLSNGILRNTLTEEEFSYPASTYHPQSQDPADHQILPRKRWQQQPNWSKTISSSWLKKTVSSTITSVTWLTFQTVNIILTPELSVSLVSGD